MSDYNPNSSDAQFAKLFQVLEDMKTQAAKKESTDTDAYALIMAKQDKTNGRVSGLETREQYAKGKVAGIALVVSVIGTVAGILFSK